MNSKVVNSWRRTVLASLLGLTIGGALGGAASADGPTLKRLFPAGAARGTTVDVASLGDAPIWPVEVWCDDPGIQWKPQADKGKFKVEVESTAILGVHHVRFMDKDNASEALRFMVGPIEEQNEVEPNDSLAKLQPIVGLPKLINGVLSKRGEVDTYAVDLEDQQTLVAAVEANANLKSPVDMTLQILSSGGAVLAQNMDTYGLDPMIDFLSPKKGRYYVRVFGQPSTPDSTIAFAGADNFVYRLTLANGGWLKAARPLGLDPKAETSLKLHGINVPGEPVVVRVPPRTGRPSWALDLPGLAHAPLIDLVDLQQIVEETRPASGIMPELKIPIAITGGLTQVKERDFYSFTANQGRKLLFTLTSRKMGLPLDGILRVMDLSGKELARDDDSNQGSDARLVFEPPSDAQYVLEVSDAYDNGGPDWLYRIDATYLVPDVAISVKDDHYYAKVNEQIEIPVTIDRRDGFDGTIQITAVLPTGQTITPQLVSTPTENTKEGKVVIKSNKPHAGPIRIIAKTRVDSDWLRTATAGGDELLKDLWLTIN